MRQPVPVVPADDHDAFVEGPGPAYTRPSIDSPRAVAHLRLLASSMTLAARWGGSSS
jgi:hypothetical protein